MNDFCDTINGKSYSIEEAKAIFAKYTLKYGGTINEKFENVNLEIYQEGLPNGSRANANTNIEKNTIRMVAGKNSIITFFHELKHLADGWKDSNGNWHTNWENEDDYTAQMSWRNQQKSEVDIIRGIKGLAMGEATAELFARKIYLDSCNNSPDSKSYIDRTRKKYLEEMGFF